MLEMQYSKNQVVFYSTVTSGYAGVVQLPAGSAAHCDALGGDLAEVSLDFVAGDALVYPFGAGVSHDVLVGWLLDQDATGFQLHGPQGQRFLRLQHENQFNIFFQARKYKQQKLVQLTLTVNLWRGIH